MIRIPVVPIRQKPASAAALLALTLLASGPSARAYDDFQLPSGVEQTAIPKRLQRVPLQKGPSEQDLQMIESYRSQIERCFNMQDYTDAEPIYQKYLALLDRLGADDQHMASALQHYADLLRKLNKTADADAADSRALTYLNRSKTHGAAYALKDYRLGMSLDEFSRMPTPVSADGKPVKAVCSCDAGQTIEVISSEDKTANVVQCGYWKKSEKDAISEPYQMTVATIQCSPDFRFIENEGSYKLFEISIGFYSSNYEEMRKALIAKYGEPNETRVDKMKTEMGNIFQQTNLIWDNGVSKIRLSNSDGTNLGRARLRYLHRQLFLAYANRVNQTKDVQSKHAADDL